MTPETNTVADEPSTETVRADDTDITDPDDAHLERVDARHDATDAGNPGGNVETASTDLPPGEPAAEDVAAAENEGMVATDPRAPGSESHELPIHRAICMAEGCKCGATYRPTSSGTGLMVLERYGMDIETALGIGPTGRPECPKGHGEMTLADEQLPIAQAINQVNARVDKAKERPLPFPAPAFNHEGALHTCYKKQHEIADLERDHERAKERTKAAKEALDEAREELGKMILEYEKREQERQFEIERRLRQAQEGHPDGTTLLRCVWEQAHPDDLCPLCTGDRAIVEKFLGRAIVARDASAHADQVVTYRTKMDVEETEDALSSVIAKVHPAVIAEWTPEQRAQVRVWAYAVVDFENGGKIQPPDRPAVLGTPHIVTANVNGAQARVQSCKECGAVLQQLDDQTMPFNVGALVGTDCPGPTEATHHYPARTAKKPRPRTAAAPAKSAKTKAAKAATKAPAATSARRKKK